MCEGRRFVLYGALGDGTQEKVVLKCFAIRGSHKRMV